MNDNVRNCLKGASEISHGWAQHRRGTSVVVGVDEWNRLPERVFAASRSPHVSGENLTFELRETKTNQLGLMVYSSLELLVQACGTGQSWTKLFSADLPWLARQVGFDALIIDVALPVELRHPELLSDEIQDLPQIPISDAPPDRIYVPSSRFYRGDRQVRLELQPDEYGQVTMLVYTSPAQLRAGCGPHQPWVAFPASELESVARGAGAQKVVFNPILADYARHSRNR